MVDHVEDSELAGIGQRILARLVDFLVFLPIFVLTFVVSDVDLDEQVFDTPFWFVVSSWLVALSYEVGLVAAYGQTLGKRVVGIVIVQESTGVTPTLRSSALRAVHIIFGWVPYVGTLLSLLPLPALWRERRRGLHDSLAGTIVVQTPRRARPLGAGEDRWRRWSAPGGPPS
jgi:uncharacterized RDD family membrane protein YckC